MIIIDSGADATAVAADPGFPRSAPDSRYPVRHKLSSWRERRACCEFLKQGHRLSPLPQDGRDNAQLFAQPRTLRIRHADSLNFSSLAEVFASAVTTKARS